MFKFSKAKAGLFVALFMLVMPYTAQAASYKVVQGDSLYLIGKKFNMTSDAVMRANNLSSTVIYPGQVLNIPGDTYTVKSGDSLYLIAKNHGVSLDALRKANNQWSDLIYPGQKLNLPGTVSSQPPAQGGNTSGAAIPYTASDLDLLARLVTAEAESEPYNAKVAVAAVVINRVKDSRFPNTLSGVIYEKSGGYYQFTPVVNGWINKPASADAKKAAYDALHGVDPSKGAMFYFDDSATNKWLWSKPLAARIGKMVFVY